MSADTVLITGADGYVGSLLAQCLSATGKRLVLLVRAATVGEWEHKRRFFASQLRVDKSRYAIVPCDLTRADAFDEVDTAGIGTIIHAAAVTRFNVDRELALATNVRGTEAVLRLASRFPQLESIELLSTLYSSGLQSGLIDEQACDDEAGFANHYEWSKHEAEMLVLRHYRHLPWRIHRLATIIAHDDSGFVVQRNAFHQSLRVYQHGLLSLVPGVPETPLYFITGRFAADAILAVMARGSLQTIYHVSHRREESVTLGELVAIAFECFEQDPAFRHKRILRPLFVDLESFRSLASAASGLSGTLVRQALEAILPFAPQLYVIKQACNRNLITAFAGHRAPGARQLVGKVCSHLSAAQSGGVVGRAA